MSEHLPESPKKFYRLRRILSHILKSIIIVFFIYLIFNIPMKILHMWLIQGINPYYAITNSYKYSNQKITMFFKDMAGKGYFMMKVPYKDFPGLHNAIFEGLPPFYRDGGIYYINNKLSFINKPPMEAPCTTKFEVKCFHLSAYGRWSSAGLSSEPIISKEQYLKYYTSKPYRHNIPQGLYIPPISVYLHNFTDKTDKNAINILDNCPKWDEEAKKWDTQCLADTRFKISVPIYGQKDKRHAFIIMRINFHYQHEDSYTGYLYKGCMDIASQKDKEGCVYFFENPDYKKEFLQDLADFFQKTYPLEFITYDDYEKIKDNPPEDIIKE